MSGEITKFALPVRNHLQVDSGPHLDMIAEGMLGRPAVREIIPHGPGSQFRWHLHDYPHPLAQWNYHPEYEIHLINNSSGRYIVGDVVESFSPGHLVLVGPNLPHHWLSELGPNEILYGRDIVLQFRGDWIDKCRQVVPELDGVTPLLNDAARGIEFTGATAERGAELLREIGAMSGLERVAKLFELLHELATAPSDSFRLLVEDWTPRASDPRSAELIGSAIEYIFANLTGDVRLDVAAKLAGMSDSAFSRYFRAASGQTFSEVVRRLRLTEACGLLARTTVPIAQIASRVGYNNLSNFNRQFREAYAMTPREYRTSRMS